jgi:hypothetical protein
VQIGDLVSPLIFVSDLYASPALDTEFYNFATRNDGLIMLLPQASLHLLLCFKLPSCFT